MDGPRGTAFRENLRRYNNIFAFTSVDCKTSTYGVTAGPLDFQIQGALYYLTGPLEEIGNRVRYAQLYFYDAQAATDLRIDFNDNLDGLFLTDFTSFLHEYNPFVQIYLTARERFRLSEE